MFRKYFLPIVAITGVALAIIVSARSNKTRPPAAAVSAAPQPPYESFVAGSGIIEANTENIAIGTQLPGIVSKLYVHVGSTVRAGDWNDDGLQDVVAQGDATCRANQESTNTSPRRARCFGRTHTPRGPPAAGLQREFPALNRDCTADGNTKPQCPAWTRKGAA